MLIQSADTVQDIYLKELKSYKPTPVKAGDADAHVQKFTAPKTPNSPEESNLADELKAYEDQKVEVEGQTEEASTSSSEVDWFEEEENFEIVEEPQH